MSKATVVKVQDLKLKTPQSLIHIKHRITLFQYKVWILLLHELKQQLDSGVPADEKGFRYVAMDHMASRLGYSPSRHDLIEPLRALRNEEICFNYLEKDGQKTKYGAGFISEWKVNRLTIGFKFPSFLEDVMLGLDDAESIFQLLNWSIFNHFSGKYEAIIYKLCKDYLGVGRTPYMTVSDFRDYMGLSNTEYIQFAELNRWTLTKPIKNINDSSISDIFVDVKFHRAGRKVEGLYFVMKPKSGTSSSLIEYEHNPAFALAKVTISLEDQQTYLAKLTPTQIQHCIERANEYGEDLERKGKKVNYGAIYKTAIAENWGEQHREQKALADKKPQDDAPPETTLEPPAKPTRTTVKKAVLERFDTLDDAAKTELVESFLAKLKGINKARMDAEYAGVKLGILANSAFSTPFATFLGKHWATEEQ